MKTIAVAVAAGVLLLGAAACGGNDEASSPTTTTTETTETTGTTETTTTETTDEQPQVTTVKVVVENGLPKGGVVRQTVSKGDRVVLVVTSDVADEIHLHGYDLSRDVAAGGTARLPFTATIPGRFEVELEARGVPIAELTVNQ
jgi:ABC-type glycerol-3-phosphate transport system substrate-binding protein